MEQRALNAQADRSAMWENLMDEVKRRYPIDRALDDMTGGVKWQGRGGQVRKACCPFHVDKTPSFQANVSMGVFYCFGAGCGASGNVFTLVRDTLGVTPRQAVLEAAALCGVTVPDELKLAGDDRIRPAIRPRRPATPTYRPGQVREIPADIDPCDLLELPDGVRMPEPGRWFPVWQDGGRHNDKPFVKKNYLPEMVHVYRNLGGQPIMAVLRCRKREGGKFFIPVRLAEPSADCPAFLREAATGDKLAFINEGPTEGTRRPVYGVEDIAEWHRRRGNKILFVEGEKCRDAAKRFVSSFDPYGEWLVLSPMGGASSTPYADWTPLLSGLDRKIRGLVWQDADAELLRPDGRREDRQKLYAGQLMTSLIQGAIDQGVDHTLIDPNWITPPKSVESGWDLADAEEQGWSAEQVRDHIVRHNKRMSADMIVTRAPVRDAAGAERPDASGAEVPCAEGPFDLPLADGLDAAWVDDDIEEDIEMTSGEPSLIAVQPEAGSHDGISFGPEPRAEAGAIDFDLLPDEGLDDVEDLGEGVALADPEPVARAGQDHADDDLVDMDEAIERNPMIANEHFRALGYLDNVDYFMSMTSKQVFALPPSGFTQQNLLHLAPLDYWRETFTKAPSGRNNEPGIDWISAYDGMVRACYLAGPWDPRREVRQGARLDGPGVVFHTGDKLYIGGEGTCDISDFKGRYCYTIGPSARTPAFDNPFPADAPEIRQFLDILSRLNWRPQTREMSILATFGWVVISPICGVLDWRAHLYLDGERGSGKTWILENLILPALGDYAERVVSNTTESGIRNLVNFRSMPVVFDEAEGEDKEARQRMDGILRLARHSASPGNSVVAHGVSGGGSQRYFSTSSTFLLTSIMPQLEAAADKTRFGRARLSSGRNYGEFVRDIEAPAADLLTPEFSDRLVARIIMRAPDYKATYRLMVEALCHRGVERRVADVYGTFAAGAWLALRDDRPADMGDAALFLGDEFKVVDQVVDFNDEMREDRDHHRVLRHIAASEIRMDTRAAGQITVQVGALIEAACGIVGDDDGLVSQKDAAERLRRIGIRIEVSDTGARPGEVFIHKNSPALIDMLAKTAYARGYVDVIHQAEGVTMGPVKRFGPGLGSSRTIVVPLEYFFIEGDDDSEK